tara:strand:- start:1982 stop:2173 length:192 start_codon:yes stop_codon:yes gene_type:complete
MNQFELEFINDLQRLKLKRMEVAEILGITMPTLKSKLKDPNKLTVGNIKALKKLNFKLYNLDV